MNKVKILLVDDEKIVTEDLSIMLEGHDFHVETTVSYSEAIELLTIKYYDILITDMILAEFSGIKLIEFATTNKRIFGSILITGYSDENSIIKATNLGVNEILKKPFSSEALLGAIDKILRKKEKEEQKELISKKLEVEKNILIEELNKKVKNSLKIIGESPKLISALRKAEILSKHQLNCLIGGESGTGKQLLAKYIHMLGPRKSKPFIEVNCASISVSLFEAEFFGYKKGAFTNAREAHAGFFEVANGGILFLDEITEIPMEIQAKLLTAVEKGVIRRVGDTKEIKIDVQIIAATNQDVDSLVEQNKIRRDLYHRISQGILILPPLRERGNDIKILLEYYLDLYENEFNKKAKKIDDELWEKIINYSWPGNIRQFTNFVKKWVLFGESTLETNTESLFEEEKGVPKPETILTFDFIDGTFSEIEKVKELLINRIIDKYNGNKSRAARHLGITYQGLLKMLKKFNEGKSE